MIARCNRRCGHLCDSKSDSFTLGRDENDLLADLDVGLVAEDTGEHELGTVANSVDGGVFDHNTLVADKQGFEWHNNASQIAFVVVLVIVPLSVFNVVHGHHGVVLFKSTTTDASKLLHVSAATEEVANMDTESTHVSASLTADPENSHVTVFVIFNQLRLVDRPDSELLLDGRNKGRSLEAGTFKRVKGLFKLLDLVKRLMELDDSDVLFTSRLLGLDQTRRVIDANNEATGDLRVKSTRVTSLVNLQDFLDPSDDLVGGGVGGLVEVNDTVLLKDVDGAVRGGVSAGKGSEV